MASRLSTLDLVAKVDAFPYADRDPEAYAQIMKSFYTFVWEDSESQVPIGYMKLDVVDALNKVPTTLKEQLGLHIDNSNRTVALFRDALDKNYDERTRLVGELTALWREQKAFPILKSWRNELWPVYGRKKELVFSMERASMGLFGTTRYGVHMNAFIKCQDASSKYDFRIWVPRRSATKSTYPSMLDNAVAGGLMTNEDPFECLIREADEEASLPGHVVRKNAKEVSTITYIYITDERAGGEAGLIYPECQWVYDLELPADGSVVPEPKDGEVESFSLRTVEEIQEQLAQGLWKPNCAVVMLDFLVRHGIYTPNNEPHYDAILDRAHRHIAFPGPHQA